MITCKLDWLNKKKERIFNNHQINNLKIYRINKKILKIKIKKKNED